MKCAKMIIGAVALLCSVMLPTLANAVTYHFTATSTQYGPLGYLEYDSSSFDGSSVQYVDNSKLLAIDFVDPQSFYEITTPGPAGVYVVFDDTGVLPRLFNASGGSGGDFIGGTTGSDGVLIRGANVVYLGQGNGQIEYSDVTWTSSALTTTPVPSALPLFVSGLGIMVGVIGLSRKRRKTTARVPA
jgi:hypothetical protein